MITTGLGLTKKALRLAGYCQNGRGRPCELTNKGWTGVFQFGFCAKIERTFLESPTSVIPNPFMFIVGRHHNKLTIQQNKWLKVFILSTIYKFNLFLYHAKPNNCCLVLSLIKLLFGYFSFSFSSNLHASSSKYAS